MLYLKSKCTTIYVVAAVDTVQVVDRSVTLLQSAIDSLPLSNARFLAPPDGVVGTNSKYRVCSGCGDVFHFTRNLPPASAPVHGQSIDVINAVHTVDVVISSIDLLELSRNIHPCRSVARLLAFEDIIVGVDSPNVAVPRSAHMLQLSWYQFPRSTAINFSPEDVVVVIYSPHFMVSRIDLLQCSTDLDPLPCAGVWAPVDVVSRVHAPYVVDGCRNVFQPSGHLGPTLTINRRETGDKPPR